MINIKEDEINIYTASNNMSKYSSIEQHTLVQDITIIFKLLNTTANKNRNISSIFNIMSLSYFLSHFIVC